MRTYEYLRPCEDCGKPFVEDSYPGWSLVKCLDCLPRTTVYQCEMCKDIVVRPRKKKYCCEECAREAGRRKSGVTGAGPRFRCEACGQFFSKSKLTVHQKENSHTGATQL